MIYRSLRWAAIVAKRARYTRTVGIWLARNAKMKTAVSVSIIGRPPCSYTGAIRMRRDTVCTARILLSYSHQQRQVLRQGENIPAISDLVGVSQILRPFLGSVWIIIRLLVLLHPYAAHWGAGAHAWRWKACHQAACRSPARAPLPSAGPNKARVDVSWRPTDRQLGGHATEMARWRRRYDAPCLPRGSSFGIRSCDWATRANVSCRSFMPGARYCSMRLFNELPRVGTCQIS